MIYNNNVIDMDKVVEIVNILIVYMSNLGLVGGFVLIVLESIIPILPVTVFVGLNVAVHGMLIGYIVSYAATVCGSMLSFILFRYVFRNLFYKIFKGKTKEKIEKLMTKISNIDYNVLVVIIAMPFTPAFAINIAAGLSNIKATKYLFSILVGKLAAVYAWCYIGDNFLDCLQNPKLIIKLVIIIVICYVISKIVEKIFKVEE